MRCCRGVTTAAAQSSRHTQPGLSACRQVGIPTVCRATELRARRQSVMYCNGTLRVPTTSVSTLNCHTVVLGTGEPVFRERCGCGIATRCGIGRRCVESPTLSPLDRMSTNWRTDDPDTGG